VKVPESALPKNTITCKNEYHSPHWANLNGVLQCQEIRQIAQPVGREMDLPLYTFHFHLDLDNFPIYKALEAYWIIHKDPAGIRSVDRIPLPYLLVLPG
jgi:hypothetical protein